MFAIAINSLCIAICLNFFYFDVQLLVCKKYILLINVVNEVSKNKLMKKCMLFFRGRLQVSKVGPSFNWQVFISLGILLISG